jgi:hypothetical protein
MPQQEESKVGRKIYFHFSLADNGRHSVTRSRIFAHSIAITAVFVTLHTVGVHSQSRSESAKPFIGMWRLVSIVDLKGEVLPERGRHPTGFIVYDASGDMSAQIMPDTTRPKYAAAGPTPEEAKRALTGYTAYFGTYRVDNSAHTVTHHRLGSINPGDVGGDAVRRYEFIGTDRVVLTPLEGSGRQLTWERVK